MKSQWYYTLEKTDLCNFYGADFNVWFNLCNETNFKRFVSPNFSVPWVKKFFLINENKVYWYGSNMVGDMVLEHFRI